MAISCLKRLASTHLTNLRNTPPPTLYGVLQRVRIPHYENLKEKKPISRLVQLDVLLTVSIQDVENTEQLRKCH